MKQFILLILMLAFFNAKSQSRFMPQSEIDSNKIALNIKLDKDTTNFFGNLWVTVKVTNKLDKDQKILFGKTNPEQSIPWGFGGVIIYNTTTQEVIRSNSPSFYSSQLYRAEDLKNDYRTIEKNNIILSAFKMTDISHLQSLAKGNYQLQVVYNNVRSNKVNLVIN